MGICCAQITESPTREEPRRKNSIKDILSCCKEGLSLQSLEVFLLQKLKCSNDLLSLERNLSYNRLVKSEDVSKIITSCEIVEANNAQTVLSTTLGALALAFTYKTLSGDLWNSSEFCMLYAKELVENIKNNAREVKIYSLLILLAGLELESIKLKNTLIKYHVFAYVVPLLNNEESEVRLIASSVCAYIYRRNQTAQDEFNSYKGCYKLLQLIKWEEDDEHKLVILIQHLLDFIYVKFTQDSNLTINHSKLKLLKQTCIFNIFTSLSVHDKSIPALEAIDSILSLMPVISR